ncbi:restriction endonuclease [Streptomyces sp. 5-6(2022)]|uniref:restriction endonuclease n=1 Tax=Streptomyces sp. 5-6(2022) TaxID=2936510 RepID=UPI0023B979CC|nr:restriction endonuclease [Streptomyces sp. 5-6(2022)]
MLESLVYSGCRTTFITADALWESRINAKTNPFAEFTSLQTEKNPQRRGVAFERLLLRLFRIAGLRAEINPTISLPRQTDLIASYGERTYLIEAKWEAKPVSVDVIDSVESRLRRTDPSVVGVVISMSGFSKTCLDEVVRKRGERTILPVDSNDVKSAMSDPSKLIRMLRTKYQRLTRMGEVWFNDPVPDQKSYFWRSPEDDHVSLVTADGTPVPWVENRAESSSPIFGSLSIPIDQPSQHGMASIKLFPDVRSLDSVKQLISYLHDGGKCDGGFRWTLTNRRLAWHGVGHPSLLSALERENRENILATQGNPGVILHCHGIAIDEFWNLSADIYEATEADNCDLSFVMQEPPLDMTRFHQITDTFGSWWESRMSWDYGNDFTFGNIEPGIELEVTGYVVSNNPDYGSEGNVIGVLARNPFTQQNPSPKSLSFPWRKMSEIICHTAPYRRWTDRRGRYYLTHWVHAEAAGATVVAFEASRPSLFPTRNSR